MILLVLVVLVVFGKVSLGHPLPCPLISIRLLGFWWFLVVLVVFACFGGFGGFGTPYHFL
jgi:hypothetical protein